MRGIFDYDGILVQTINRVICIVYASFLWFIFSIPLFTFGASATALYHTVYKVIRYERGHIFSEFFRAFRTNFKQATLIWLLLCAICLILMGDCYFLYLLYLGGFIPIFVVIVFLIFFAFALIWGIYMFAYVARFSNTLKHILKNSMNIMVQNIGWSILLILVLAASVFLCVLRFWLIMLIPVCCSLLQNLIIEHVFKKYRDPDEIEQERQINENSLREWHV